MTKSLACYIGRLLHTMSSKLQPETCKNIQIPCLEIHAFGLIATSSFIDE